MMGLAKAAREPHFRADWQRRRAFAIFGFRWKIGSIPRLIRDWSET